MCVLFAYIEQIERLYIICCNSEKEEKGSSKTVSIQLQEHLLNFGQACRCLFVRSAFGLTGAEIALHIFSVSRAGSICKKVLAMNKLNELFFYFSELVCMAIGTCV